VCYSREYLAGGGANLAGYISYHKFLELNRVGIRQVQLHVKSTIKRKKINVRSSWDRAHQTNELFCDSFSTLDTRRA